MDNINITFCSKLYRQIVGIPTGTNRAPLEADLSLFCYERDFKTSLSDDNQVDIIEALNSTSKNLDLIKVENSYFEEMVNQIYPPELQLNKANISDTEAPVLDLHLSIMVSFPPFLFYNNNNKKFRSFESKQNIHKKKVGPYHGVGY